MNVALEQFEMTDHNACRSEVWLNKLANYLGSNDQLAAYRTFKAVLPALRDLLPDSMIPVVSSGLPALLRGAFFTGWRAGDGERRIYSKKQLLADLYFAFPCETLDEIATAVEAVFRVLEEQLPITVVVQMRALLPRSVRTMLRRPLRPSAVHHAGNQTQGSGSHVSATL